MAGNFPCYSPPATNCIIGYTITNSVRNTPNRLTVHFGGQCGRAVIRQNYMSRAFKRVGATELAKSEKIFKDVTERATSYTYRSLTGLLSATQFNQRALTLILKAYFEDMRSRGLVGGDSVFAGHSLGECSALATLAEVMPIEPLVSVVFYRRLTMHVAVEPDTEGRSNYSMIAVNATRISGALNEVALQYVVGNISQGIKGVLGIVNYKVIIVYHRHSLRNHHHALPHRLKAYPIS